MTYATLMVQLELEHSNDARVQVAGDLAERFDAKLIGIAACELSAPAYYAEGAVAQALFDEVRTGLNRRMAETEERFRATVQGRAKKVEWRGALALPTDYVEREARAADLIITGANHDSALLDPSQRVDPSALVMQAGRPVLIVPAEAELLRLNTVLVAWKDTREARRAVHDALPLLRQAKEVSVVEIVEDGANPLAARKRVNDVVGWLGGHGIAGAGTVSETDELAADCLESVASDIAADLIVAGAYGHSRFREWVFGGVTRSLLTRSTRFSLLAH